MPTAIIAVATGYVVETGAVPDGITYAKVTCATNPDGRTQKWNGTEFVAKTAAEITTYDADRLAAQSLSASRRKETLAMLAVVVRAKNPLLWDAMTSAQQVEATLAEADMWKTLREWVETKIP